MTMFMDEEERADLPQAWLVGYARESLAAHRECRAEADARLDDAIAAIDELLARRRSHDFAARAVAAAMDEASR